MILWRENSSSIGGSLEYVSDNGTQPKKLRLCIRCYDERDDEETIFVDEFPLDERWFKFIEKVLATSSGEKSYELVTVFLKGERGIKGCFSFQNHNPSYVEAQFMYQINSIYTRQLNLKIPLDKIKT